MQAKQIGDVVVHYRHDPAPAGRATVVFINSLGTDFRIWDDVRAELDCGTLAFDLRGHGLSGIGRTPYAIADLAGDLAGLMDALEIGAAVICGLSVGGQVAQELYHRRPDLVAGLVLCDTAARIGEPDFWNQRIATIRQSGLAAAAPGILARWFGAAFREKGGAQFQLAAAMFERQPVEGYLATCAAIAAYDRRADAAAIAVPVSVVVGSEDGATPPALVEAFAASIPGATFQIIEGAGHLPCVEAPGTVAAAIAGLIGRVEQRSSAQ
ncbi:3-oxoadipate enol-lactonase [Pelagibacterium lacus]|uniref:3-oxoadipate enol-lactonase n=1 Tax=Pelagibacterium lacus TaxID=2282655 RepID=A0A369W6T6_9HYPH|nr:3-oxoadipate enol-lactonase [Pelagibacterium lacus]RDE09719.1 3-oxoadipate enol-lactonase [Pelagibacterium lacus]